MKLLTATAALTLLAACCAANAGIISGSTKPWMSPNHPSDSVVAIVNSDGSMQTDATIDLTDAWGIKGMLDSDPHVRNIETITNTTAFDWTSFQVTVTPDANSTVSNLVADFPTTDHFTTSSTLADTLTFSGGVVHPGDTVNLDFAFDLNAIINNGTGQFNFAIANSPAPEPASLALLSSAAFLLLKRRRR